MSKNPNSRYTVAGTDIEEVKEKNAHSGMTYNQVKNLLAQTVRGHEAQSINRNRSE
ncbi:hypothetical protein [Falsibacillus albus]|uniref:hypothetical protein n=1 Tax=Falsibacillus albus TaxID=2478915 RepID=UPI0018F5EAD4|nr:hypothetical protein [Falsibacillus albus]